jgi:hypothetical protein
VTTLTDIEQIMFLLHAQVSDLVQERRPGRQDKVTLPRLQDRSRMQDETVEVGEMLIATLRAVALATGQLKEGSTGIALASEPINMQISGELTGVTSPQVEQIFIRMKLDD